jgi:ferredoxin-NADP reductase
MEKELRENQWVWVKLPYGDFVIEGTGNTVLLAGGTGITAFISFIAGLPDAFPGRILLAYGARKSELLLYRDVLDSSMAKHQDVKILYFVENGTKNETSTDSLLPFEFTSGCLSIDTFWNDLPDPTSATFYIAGPPAMIRAVSENLTKKNVVPEKIKVDAWE